MLRHITVIRAILILVSIFSNNVLSADIYSVNVFMADDAKVTLNSSANYHLNVYDVGKSAKTTFLLNDAVRQRVSARAFKPETITDMENAYRSELLDLMNSDYGRQLEAQYDSVTEGVSQSLRFGIQKVPAIVINDMYVIYGVTSIAEAEKIYVNWDNS